MSGRSLPPNLLDQYHWQCYNGYMSDIDSTTAMHGVLERVISGQSKSMSLAAAEYWSSMTLPANEQERLNYLAEKNRANTLNDDEQGELSEFVEAIELVDLLKAQALSVLAKQSG